MKNPKKIYFSTRGEWREWLKKNHHKNSEIWLIFYKKNTGKPTLEYNASVEEALCFGWIDSIIKKLDKEKYIRKFTPRKHHSRWSELNKKRAENMIKQKKMTKFGIEKIQKAKKTSIWNKPSHSAISFKFPEELKHALKNNPKAKKIFEQLAPSFQNQYLGWISVAKKQETKQKRVKEAIDQLTKGKKLGLK